VQGAVDRISKEESKLTIIIIAHRLTTIETAENLLYIEDKDKLILAKKGSEEYRDIMRKLRSRNYAHQEEQEQMKIEEVHEKSEIQQQLSREFSMAKGVSQVGPSEVQVQAEDGVQDKKQER